jgi:hypothetical protein
VAVAGAGGVGDDADVVVVAAAGHADVEVFAGGGAVGEEDGPVDGDAFGFVDDQRNAKLILNVVLGGDGAGYDLYRRRAPGRWG